MDNKKCKVAYSKLVKLCRKTNDCFKNMILSSFTHYCLWLIYETYHLVILVTQTDDDRYDVKLVVFSTSWIVTNGIAIVSVLTCCHMAKREAKRYKEFWWFRKLEAEELNNGFIKMLNLKVEFTGGNMFNLDLKHLLKVRL